MTYHVEIDLKAASLQEARDTLEQIAADIEGGVFSAMCTKDQREEYGGSVFVVERS